MVSKGPIPEAHRTALVETTKEFAVRLNALFGFYLDSAEGFRANVSKISKAQEMSAHLVSDLAELDQLPFFIGQGDPNEPNNVMLHQTTQGQFKTRNDTGGSNYRLLSHIFIVFLFELWEEEYRLRIATWLSIEKNELTLPILGDLRHLRNAVLHHRGVLTEKTHTKLEAIGGLEVGQVINFTEDDIVQLVRRIKAALDELVRSATGTDPELRTIWHIR
jgi:hypothetical protein